MIRNILSLCLLLTTTLVFGQTSLKRVNVSDSSEFFLQKGLLEKKNGRRLESLKQFEKALSFDSDNKTVVLELASAYMDLRKYNQARDSYKKLVQLGEESASNYKQLMVLSYNLKQNDDVLMYADKLKAADPSEKVYYYVGRANYDMDNYGEAIKFLNAAAKEDPTNAEVPYMIAHSYADMMNYKQAIPHFQKAIQLNPDKGYWIYEMGLIYYAMHDDKNSLKYILMAGEKGYTRDNDYLENLGIAYLNVGNLDEGVKILNEILVKKPSDMNILNMVAEAYYYKGKYKQAIEYWDKVLYYDNTAASALYMIGMSYQKNGDKDKGMQLCDKAIEMDPNLAAYKQKKMMAGL